MPDRIEDLIPRIYEAALEPEHWPDVLRGISRLTGDSVVYLCHEPLIRFGAGYRWTHNFDLSVLEKWTEEEWTRDGNPSIAAVIDAPVGTPFDRRAVFDDHAYVRSPVMQKAMLPHGLFHAVLSAVQRQDETVSATWIARTLRAAVDRLGVAMVLVDHECRVRYANLEAERVLSAGDGLRLVAGRLIPAASAARRRLEALVGRCRAPAPHVASFGGDHVVVPRPSGSPAYGLCVAPAVGAGASAWLPGASAVVFITDPARERALPMVEWLCLQFGLTPAEAKVARLVANGHGLPHVAHALGITLNTAKTHLKAIYGKTGTDRQARLTRLILESAPPLVPGAAALHPGAQESDKEAGLL